MGYWATRSLTLASSPLDVTIKPRSSVRSVAAQLQRGGVPMSPALFELMARALGEQGRLKSGDYEFRTGITPYGVLRRMVLGDVNEGMVTIIEGWTFHKMRAELDANPALRHDTAAMTDAQLLAALGVSPAPLDNAEGLFFPDTYLFDKNSSDLNVYRRAYRQMQKRLTGAWDARAPNLPLATPYEALTLASLVEKETGRGADRSLVSAVFINRLRAHMPLQTDPTVIYGLGSAYQGRLHKSDLKADTIYNTYVHTGLPPTPIALPGAAALYAALHPAPSAALYFVARGDGSSVFSDTLSEHNKAVEQYILDR